MPNYSLNNAVPEPDRSLNDVGYQGNFHLETHPDVEREAGVPYNSASPLQNKVNESSDTQRLPFPQASGEIARRTS